MPYSHMAYGLRISASAAIPGLPVQDVLENTDLNVRLKDGSSFPSISDWDYLYTSQNRDQFGQAVLKVARGSGGPYAFFYSDGVRFVIDPQGREVRADWLEGYSLEDACTYLLGPVLAFVLRLRGVTCLHASAVAIDNCAVALLGQQHAGKSTTAASFARSGFSILSDDVVALVDNRERFLAQPGYPRLNLWPDSVSTLFGSENALAPITPTWDKRFLALGHGDFRFQTSPLPLKAIYFLNPRDPNLSTHRIEELSPSSAMMTLVTNTYVSYLLDRDMRRREFDVLGRLAAAVPVLSVFPSANPSSLDHLCESIVEDVQNLVATRTAAAGESI